MFSNLKSFPLRLISVLSDVIVCYFAVSVSFAFFGIGDRTIGLSTLAAVSTASLIIGLVRIGSAYPRLEKAVYILSGLGAAFLAVLLAEDVTEPFLLGLKGLVFLALWFVSVRKAGLDARELFTSRQFYIRTVITALSAALIGGGARQTADYALVIVFTAVYLFGLLRVKRFSFSGGGQEKRDAFIEITVILVIILAAFLLVSPAAISTLGAIFTVLYGFVSRLLLYILAPVARLVAFLIGVARGMRSGIAPGGGESSAGKAADLPGYSVEITPSFLESVSGALIYIILAAAACLVIFFSLRRLKSRRGDPVTQAFSEERETVLNFGGNVGKRLSRLGRSFSNGLEALQRINSNNAQKLRYEYRRLLRILNKKGLIAGSVTAESLSKRVAAAFSEAGPDIGRLTALYEETRYGKKLPTDEEYREFKRKVGNIVDIVGKSH